MTKKLPIFTLEDGREITQVPLKGRDYFKFKSAVVKDISAATQQLMLKMFQIDGEQITIDALEELPFEAVAAMDAIVNAMFPNSQNP